MHKNLLKLIFKNIFSFFCYLFNFNKLIKNKQNGYSYIRSIMIKFNRQLKLDIELIGIENIPNSNFIIFSNHRGLYDPIIISTFIKDNLSYVMKSKLCDNFFIKKIGIITNSEYFERNPKDDMKTIIKMIENNKKGINYLIFPEGTRNKEKTLLEFKAGSFKIPLKSKCDIVPVCIYNTEYILDDETKKTPKIYISFLHNLKYEDYKDMKTTELSKIIQTQIQEEYNHIKEKTSC